jgi:hypothetical protein
MSNPVPSSPSAAPAPPPGPHLVFTPPFSDADWEKFVDGMYPDGLLQEEKKVEIYLDRIGFQRDVNEPAPSPYIAPTLANLNKIIRCHIHSIPFDNSCMHRGFPYIPNIDAMFHRMIIERRGGFCMDLQAMLQWLLKALGYNVWLFATDVNLA